MDDQINKIDDQINKSTTNIQGAKGRRRRRLGKSETVLTNLINRHLNINNEDAKKRLTGHIVEERGLMENQVGRYLLNSTRGKTHKLF